MKTAILMVGQASQKTGLARVTRCMADHLALSYDMHVLGIDCFDLREAGLTERNWTLHGNPSADDLFAELRLPALVEEIRPEIVVLYNDLGVIDRYFYHLAATAHRSSVIGYCPVDGRIVLDDLVSGLAPLDKLVVFTEFARSAVLESARRSGLAERETFAAMHVIPHGLDADVFHPWPGYEADDSARRRAARQALLPDRPAAWDGFWVLNANRNQPRKRLEITLEGFALFAAGKPADVRLYLHTGMTEIGIDILQHAQMLGISDRLLLTRTDGHHPSSAVDQLNAIYNACEVGVNTASGEGWGLVSCEHGATMAAQIVPRHSACAEIWDSAAEFLEPVASVSTGLLEGHLVSSRDLAAALEKLYGDIVYRRRMTRAAYDRATCAAYRWPQVAAQWRQLFEETLVQRRRAAEACDKQAANPAMTA